jgi:hypothetical protein
MRSLRCSALHPNLGHLDRRISRRGFLAGSQAEATRMSAIGRPTPVSNVEITRPVAVSRPAMRPLSLSA